MHFYENNFNPMIRMPIILHCIISFIVIHLLLSLIKFIGNIVQKTTLPVTAENKPFNDKKVFIISAIALMLVWLIHVVIKYPGAMSWDTWVMLDEYFYSEISEYQSIFYTYFMGVLVKGFIAAGYPNVGMFIFVILHYLAYVVVFAYSFVVLNRLCVPKYWFIITGIIYAINPYIIGYLGVAIKDCLYGILVFAALLTLINIKTTGECKRINLIGLALLILFACLTRKNGVYVFVIYVATLYILPHTRKSKNNSKIRLSAEMALVMYLVVVCLLRMAINPIPDNTVEMYSLPFQQTARYVRDHGDEVTEEEREIISKVLDYDNLATNYNPRLSDGIKNGANGSISVIRPYFKVWFQQFLKHPVTYISATWEQNFYFLSPEAEYEDNVYYINAHECHGLGEIEYIGAYPELFKTDDHSHDIQFKHLDFLMALHKIPVIRIFWNTSYAFFILAFITLELIIRKKDISILIPLWMTIVFIIIGPVLHGHPRYMFPIIYALPILISYYRFAISKSDEISPKKLSDTH